jgi:hypothetical protein
MNYRYFGRTYRHFSDSTVPIIANCDLSRTERAG